MPRHRNRLPFGAMARLGAATLLRRSPVIAIPVYLAAILPRLLVSGFASGFTTIVWYMVVSILGQIWATAICLRSGGRRIAGGLSGFALALAALLILRSVHLAPMLFVDQAAPQMLGLGCCSAPLFSVFLARFGMTPAFALAGEPRALTASLRGASPIWAPLALVAVAEWALRFMIVVGIAVALAGLGLRVTEADPHAVGPILVFLTIDLLVASTYAAGYLILSTSPDEDRIDELF